MNVQPGSPGSAKDTILKLFDAALGAVDPRVAVAGHLGVSGATVRVGDREIQMSRTGRVHMVALGKAAVPMAKEATAVLGKRICGGVVVAKGSSELPQRIGSLEVIGADHPVPGEASLRAGKEICRVAQGLAPEDLLLVLLSGGGSALLAVPVVGISLDDLKRTTDILLACGADITEMNTVRKHLSATKGGRLASLAFPAGVAALVLSDVVGDDLSTIASGPFVGDDTSFGDALEVLCRYRVGGRVPPSVMAHLTMGARGEIDETPDSTSEVFARVSHKIVGSGATAAAAALKKAGELGLDGRLVTTTLGGEAWQLGRELARGAVELVENGLGTGEKVCLIYAGESTVVLRGEGRGGRNQELALAAAICLEGTRGVTLASLATDGQDGPTDAAGAVVDGRTVERSRKLGLDPESFLSRNDSYGFFSATKELVTTGQTMTNVADLVFVLLER